MHESASERPPAHVDVAGPEDAPPVVLVHGTIFNRTMWAPQRDALADEFRVVAPDLPGHGERRDETFRLEDGVETVARTVEHTTDDSVGLVGLSLGGYVATAYARRHPESVRGLVLAGSSANPVGFLGLASEVGGGAALLASKSRLIERGVDRLAAWYVRNGDVHPRNREEIVAAGFDLEPFGRAGFEIAGEDFRAMLGGFEGPALVLNGRWDLLMRLGEDAHADAAAEASVAVIDGAGHVCNLDRPDEFEAAVRRFVGSVGS